MKGITIIENQPEEQVRVLITLWSVVDASKIEVKEAVSRIKLEALVGLTCATRRL